MKANVYQAVTERILEQMSKGIIPWQQPWSGDAEQAISYSTGKPYSFLNQMLLGMRGGEYLTFNQVKAQGGRIKKGAKAGMVVFFKQIVVTDVKVKENENGEKEEVKEQHLVPLLTSYNVFHINDCEGIKSKREVVEPDSDIQPLEAAECAIGDYLCREKELTFQNNRPSDSAYYSPSRDEVVVPMLNQYEIAEEYYSTTFHELVHSTMKESRCNRKQESKLAAFGSEDYSREELVAEIGSAMLCNVLGIECAKAFKNSVAYIQGWAKKLKKDPKAIVYAASKAETAAKYILNK